MRSRILLRRSLRVLELEPVCCLFQRSFFLGNLRFGLPWVSNLSNFLVMKFRPQILLALIIALSVFALSGCNTVKGVGKDFQAMGESIQNAGN